jgi:hypothetical protein
VIEGAGHVCLPVSRSSRKSGATASLGVDIRRGLQRRSPGSTDFSVTDLAAPGTGLRESVLDELAKEVEISLGPAGDEPKALSHFLDQVLGFEIEGQLHPGGARAERFEGDSAAIARPFGAHPLDCTRLLGLAAV